MFQFNKKHKVYLDIQKQLKKVAANDILVVGYPKEKQNAYPDGTPVAQVAALNEFGSESNKIPARPFLKTTMHNNRSKYKKILKASLKRIVTGKETKKKELDKLGLIIEKDVKETITSIRSPKNSAKTIARKKSSNPLIDTGHLRASVSHEIRERKVLE